MVFIHEMICEQYGASCGFSVFSSLCHFKIQKCSYVDCTLIELFETVLFVKVIVT